MTITQRHAIFREKALKHYTQGRKKDVLPNFRSISAGFFAWLLLVSLIATGLVAWFGQVPIFLAGSGIVLGSQAPANSTGESPRAVAFFAPEKASALRVGDTVQVQLGASSSHINGTVAQVLSGTTDLATALAHYGVNLGASSSQSQQVAVALITLKSDAALANAAGSTVVVEVVVGMQSLFSALTGVGV